MADSYGHQDRRGTANGRPCAVTPALGLPSTAMTGVGSPRLMFESFELTGTWGVIYGIMLGAVALLIVLARGRGCLASTGRRLLVVVLAFVSRWPMRISCACGFYLLLTGDGGPSR